jgi:hypothetical protein
MPTKRSIQQLYDFFEPGQPAASITPDRVQDLILSVLPGFGRISLTAQVGTSITQTNQWVKLAGTTALGEGAFTFTMPQNGRLQCVCPVPSRMTISAAVTLTNGSQKDFQVALARNGEIMTETIQGVRFGPGGGSVEASLFGDFAQQQNDHVEIWVRNITDTTNITATKLYMRAMTNVL